MSLQTTIKCLSISILLALFSGSLFAEPSKAEMSNLRLHSETKWQTVNLKPDVNFSDYQSINLEDVSITFKKNWLENYNRDRKSLAHKLNEKDITTIKKRFAEQFMKSFSKKLTNNTGYSIVNNRDKGTLLFKPSIIDMVLNGPDKRGSTATVTMVYTAGKATLSLEIYDAKTEELLGTMLSKRKTREYHDLRRSNLIFNKTEFIPIFNYWAKNLLEAIK